jgi:hypothetical protein
MYSRKGPAPKGAKKVSRLPKAESLKTKVRSSRIAPTALGEVISPNVASISSQANGVVVRHREFVSDVTNGPTDVFATDSWYVNPRNADLFPWLSRLASCYETYTFNRLSFRYEPSCPTTTSGAAMLAIDYDITDDEPLDKAQMLSYKGCVRTAPWASAKMLCDPTDLTKFKVHWNESESGPTADRTEDVGRLIVGRDNLLDSSGAIFSGSIGELWVEYEVVLQTPHIPSVAGATYYSTGTVTSADFLGPSVKTIPNAGRPIAAYYPSNGGAPAYLKFLQNFEGTMELLTTAATSIANAYSVVTCSVGAIVEQLRELSSGTLPMYGFAGVGLATTWKILIRRGQIIDLARAGDFVGALAGYLWFQLAPHRSMISPIIPTLGKSQVDEWGSWTTDLPDRRLVPGNFMFLKFTSPDVLRRLHLQQVK